MTPPKEPDHDVRPPHPWIFSATYWNDVAKDVVKATTAALVIYLFGVIGGVFKLHIAILWIVLVILAGSLLFGIIYYLSEKGKSRWSGLSGAIVGGLGGVALAAIIHSKWSGLPGWAYFLVGVGFSLVAGGIGAWLAASITKNGRK